MGVSTNLSHFNKATRKGDAFLIYVFPTLHIELPHHEIPSQYKEFKDMFEKKNTNTLLERHPYDYTIDLEKKNTTSIQVNLQHVTN
jgi:hypothetical protein